MKIAIANDHVAVDLKDEIKAHLQKLNHEVIDCGTNTSKRADYPIYAKLAADKVVNGEVERAILICGTGVGISIAANKIKGVRAVVCSEPYSARLSREHNDTNVLAFGSRVVGLSLAKMIVDNWLAGQYEAKRHQRRLELIKDIENEQ